MTVVPMPKRARANDKLSLAAEAAEPKNAVAKPYVPTEREVAAQASYNKRRRARPPVPLMKVTMIDKEGGKIEARLEVDHADPTLGYELISEAIASDSGTFLSGTIDALAMVAQQGNMVNQGNMNYALSLVSGLKPKDQIEATLGVQMAAIHLATLSTAASMASATTWQLRETQERALNRLTRTFAAQMEALKRYRSKGEQRVIVERVNVEKGGQAIVGNVAHGGRVGEENDR